MNNKYEIQENHSNLIYLDKCAKAEKQMDVVIRCALHRCGYEATGSELPQLIPEVGAETNEDILENLVFQYCEVDELALSRNRAVIIQRILKQLQNRCLAEYGVLMML